MSDQWNLVTGLSGSGHKSEDTILLLIGIHSIHFEYVCRHILRLSTEIVFVESLLGECGSDILITTYFACVKLIQNARLPLWRIICANFFWLPPSKMVDRGCKVCNEILVLGILKIHSYTLDHWKVTAYDQIASHQDVVHEEIVVEAEVQPLPQVHLVDEPLLTPRGPWMGLH